ncbi:hypothetical protein [Planctomicrobium piriforme]|uniref:hypothetical protein n=1 Tax=Planctomicrobium piriforme TaxID=1576369 RepID=UPI001114020D|nr:hypothetical protein [Planctomicrobium piriforme]
MEAAQTSYAADIARRRFTGPFSAFFAARGRFESPAIAAHATDSSAAFSAVEETCSPADERGWNLDETRESSCWKVRFIEEEIPSIKSQNSNKFKISMIQTMPTVSDIGILNLRFV